MEKQCKELMSFFGITEDELIDKSYSDMI